MKKKVLICGATGFIGRNIAGHLAGDQKYEVYGTYCDSEPLRYDNISMLPADLTNKDDVNRVVGGMDIIIQAAATTSGVKDIVTKPYYHVTANAVMNSLLFRAAFEQNISHLLFFSCTVMYQPSDTPVKESDFNPNNPIYANYFGVGWTKVYIEKMCEFYSSLGRTKYTVFRHSNIYGPHDKFDLEKSHVFGATITKVMTADEGNNIIVWGSGQEERDLLYIDDLIACTESALDRQKARFELFNVGSGEAVSVKELVQRIIRSSGKNVGIEYDSSKPTIKTKLCLDCTKAKEALGWEPHIFLDEGIKKTIEWYKKNIT